MTLYDQWLADPRPISFSEFRRELTVPVALRSPAPPQKRVDAAPSPKPRRARPVVPGRCGGPGTARRHRQRGEPVCDACREAENAAQRNDTKRKSQREWVARKRAAARQAVSSESPGPTTKISS